MIVIIRALSVKHIGDSAVDAELVGNSVFQRFCCIIAFRNAAVMLCFDTVIANVCIGSDLSLARRKERVGQICSHCLRAEERRSSC